MTDADLIALFEARARAKQDLVELQKHVDLAHSRLVEAEHAINAEMTRRNSDGQRLAKERK